MKKILALIFIAILSIFCVAQVVSGSNMSLDGSGIPHVEPPDPTPPQGP